MKALVTGANGFLGSHLCRRLLNEGFTVTAFCRPTSDTTSIDGLPLLRQTGDVTDRRAVFNAVKETDYLFHAAAHGMYWGRGKERQTRTNIDGTRNVVDACLDAHVKRLVFISSMTAIGIPDGPERPVDENFRFNLEGTRLNYHISKKQAEAIVLEAVNKGLDAVIVNPGNIWGPFGKKFRVAEHVQKVRQRRTVPYFTGGICVVHVDDVIDGIMAALRSGRTGERYILGGENVPLRKIAEMAAAHQGMHPRFIPLPRGVTWLAAATLESIALVSRRRPRITFVTHDLASRFQYYDSEKARKELGFKARDFKTILTECFTFLESQNGHTK